MKDAVVHDLDPVLRRHAARLRAAGVPSPENDVRLLAAHVSGDDAGSPGRPRQLRRDQLARLAALVDERAARVPLQHLIGEVWFRHVRLRCRPGVFIPRPETEVVAGVAIEAAAALDAPLVLEPCTGSGAIAMSLAAEVPHVRVVATDRSADAVALARENLDRLARGQAGMAGPAEGASWSVLEGDLLAPVEPALRGHVDVLVGNPPYMPARDRDTWEPEVALHDPLAATVGGEDGHEVVWELLEQSLGWVRPGGVLVLEIDERRGTETATRAGQLGYVDVAVQRDLTGADRVLVARTPAVVTSEVPR